MKRLAEVATIIGVILAALQLIHQFGGAGVNPVGIVKSVVFDIPDWPDPTMPDWPDPTMPDWPDRTDGTLFPKPEPPPGFDDDDWPQMPQRP